jgi:hypothetical protein
MYKARDTIAALSTTKGLTQINKSPKDKGLTQLKDRKCVWIILAKGGWILPERNSESEKRILFASEAPESLRNSEPEGSGSTDGVRRNSSHTDTIPARSKNPDHADNTGKGRKDPPPQKPRN